MQAMKYLKSGFYVLALFLLQTSFVMAQTNPPSTSGAVRLRNPLQADNLVELLTGILQVVITIAVPFIVFFIIYAGFLYVTAKGNSSQVEQATRALTYAIIGGVIIIGAVTIAGIVRNMVTSF